MSRRVRVAALVVAGVGCIAARAAAQGPSLSRAEAEEVAFARTAAPAVISDSADVLVLRDSGYAKVRTGTTGAACLVSRPRNGSVVPVCYDPRAARSVLRAELMAHRLRSGGMSPEAADSAVEQAYRAGTIAPPAAGSLAWMMSPRQVFITPSGQNIGAWRPHIMIYAPSTRPDSVGFASVGRGDMFVDKAGEALAHVVVVTASWADGARGPD